ncbi:MAG: hypothetical protein CFE21_04160 [Bacteroidetes bacterium B1(2017)]|nr:MAG: hypothetical protein CFE21_04160 [Bacteroidetes bacterium B1(2017)]
MKKNLLSIVLILALFSLPSYAITPRLRLGFVENLGEVVNQYGQVNKEVLYHFASGQLNVQLRANGFSYDVFEKNQGVKVHRIDIDFVGANVHSKKLTLNKAEGQIIYRSKLNASDEKVLSMYKKIYYQNVYPNIDIEFVIYEDKGQEKFKYNFILKPGANSQDIKLNVLGARDTRVTNKGNIAYTTRFGKMEERVPLSYEQEQTGEQGKTILAKFKQIGSNLIGLNIGNYNKGKTLVIDPMIWSTYFGGNSAESSGGVAVDDNGNIYIGGRTSSTTFVATIGSHQTSLGSTGGYDGFIAKFSSSGGLFWATYYGGVGTDEITELAIDKQQNLIAVGSTSSTSGIATFGAFQTTLNGSINGMLIKFAPTGTLIWATYYGGNGTDAFYGIEIGKNSDINVIGSATSTNTLSYSGVHQTTNAGLTDVLLVKFNLNGIVKWATYYGGTLNDNAYGIVSDVLGNIYLTGNSFSASGLSTTGAYQTSNGGASDLYFAKFDSLGTLKYGTYYGGTASDVGIELMLDAEGKIVIVGHSSSTSNVATTGAFQTTITGSAYDGIILRMDTAGAILWCTYYGSSSTEMMSGLAGDAAGNIFFSGNSSSSSGIATSGAYQTVMSGIGDAIFGCFDKTGARLWCSYFGGPTGMENVSDIYFDKLGNLLVIGGTSSDVGIATVGAYQTTRQGNSEVFLFKYFVGLPASNTPISNNTISPNQGVCLGNAAQTLTGTTPTGGDGMFNYQWLSSPTGLAGSFVPAFGTNANDTYIPGSLTVNTYYKRVVFSGTQTDTSNMISVLVSPNLSAGFTVNKTIQCVRNNQFIFTDTTTSSAGALSYWWDFGNGKTSTNQTDTISYAASVDNLFKVRLVTSLNGGCADTSYTQVILINNPLAKTISGKDTVMKGTTEPYMVSSTNGSSYAWYYTNGTGRSTTNSINIKWTLQGAVQLALLETNGGGCKGDTSYKNIYVKLPTSEEEVFGSDLTIYPNPSEGVLTIETGSSENFHVKITSLSGQIIYSDKGSNQLVIDLNTELAGIYILQITTEQGQSLHRKIHLIR